MSSSDKLGSVGDEFSSLERNLVVREGVGPTRKSGYASIAFRRLIPLRSEGKSSASTPSIVVSTYVKERREIDDLLLRPASYHEVSISSSQFLRIKTHT